MTEVFVRLAPCPRCASRERMLVDIAGTEPGGLCSHCGESLEEPLATEVVREEELLLLGRRDTLRLTRPVYHDD